MSSIALRRTLLALVMIAAIALVGFPSLAAAAGMLIDPNGAHRAAVSGFPHLAEDAGMTIDPYGAQRSASGLTHLSRDPDGAR
jgi:hypothetical protein